MCSRYRADVTAAELAARFGVPAPPGWEPRAELAAGDEAPALIAAPAPRFSLLRFGLRPGWAGEDAKPQLNARAESAADKPYFRDAYRRRRCLVPARAWFETPRRGPDKSPRRLERLDGALFAFAGLWEPGCFAILTVEPNPLVAAVHERMPALLAPDAEAAWLDPRTPRERLRELLLPYPSELLACAHELPQAQGDLFGAG